MDDLRQHCERSYDEGGSGDVTGLQETEAASRLAHFEQPARWHGDLARVVEAEIIPMMMLAHRAESSTQPTRNLPPTSDEIGAFAELVLSPGCDDVEVRVAAMVANGLSLDSLLLDLLAPTARHLGFLWDEDLCDFAEMTMAMGRLQRITHDLTLRFGNELPARPRGRKIFLLPCPGETHSFGLSLIERFFRDAGWDVTCAMQDPGIDPFHRARSEWFDVIGLSLGCETLLPALAETVEKLRRMSRNPRIRVMVGGPIFLDNPDVCEKVGADATAGDARHAIAIAERMLDLQTLAC